MRGSRTEKKVQSSALCGGLLGCGLLRGGGLLRRCGGLLGGGSLVLLRGGSLGLGDAARLGLAQDTRHLLLDGGRVGRLLAGLAGVGLGLCGRLGGGLLGRRLGGSLLGGGGLLLLCGRGSLLCGGCLGLLFDVVSFGSMRSGGLVLTVVVAFLVFVAGVFFSVLPSALDSAFAAAGLAGSFFASFTVPEGPGRVGS